MDRLLTGCDRLVSAKNTYFSILSVDRLTGLTGFSDIAKNHTNMKNLHTFKKNIAVIREKRVQPVKPVNLYRVRSEKRLSKPVNQPVNNRSSATVAP